VLQAWFDESGKTASDENLAYILAGFVARKRNWQTFTDEWQKELDRRPQLPFVHAKEAHSLKGPFSGWSKEGRDKRLLKFADIVVSHVPEGRLFLLDHHSFSKFREIIIQHPTVRTNAEKRLFTNPFFLGFLAVFALAGC
jgi:hypothetical protein